MTGGRDRILERVRTALGREGRLPDAEVAALSAHLAQHPAGPRPPSDWEPVARFRERALALASTLDEVETLHAVPGTVGRYLAQMSLPRSVVVWPEFAPLGWEEAGIEAEARKAGERDPVGVTGCFCAIAETGTLVQLSGNGRAASTSLLPETHIAIVPSARIVRDMEDAWTLMRRECRALPRAVNFISGPSRTADIEQTIVLGAHGPYRVHIVLVHR